MAEQIVVPQLNAPFGRVLNIVFPHLLDLRRTNPAHTKANDTAAVALTESITALYRWVPTSLSIDDGNVAIKPNVLTSLQPGRWLLQDSPRDVTVRGAALTFRDVSTVAIGTVGKHSKVIDFSDAHLIAWDGELPISLTTVGAGGLQTGASETADTWYRVLAIGDTSGANAVNGLLLPNGTGFNEPGYDVFKQVGWARNDGGSDIIDFIQVAWGVGRLQLWISAASSRLVLTAGAATVPTPVDCSPLVPPTSRIMFASLVQNGAPNVSLRLSVAGPIIATLTKEQAITGIVAVDNLQRVFYENSTPAGSVDIGVRGFLDTLE